MLLHILNCLVYAGLVAYLYRDIPRAAIVLSLLIAGFMFLCRGMKRRALIGTLLGLAFAGTAWAIWHMVPAAVLAGATAYLYGGCAAYDVLHSQRMRHQTP